MAGPALKVLASLRPAASGTTVASLYAAPALTQVVVSKLIITNDSATATTVNVAIVLNAGTCAAKNVVMSLVTIAGNDFLECLQGVTLAAGDFICVGATLATVNFNLFGQENS